MRWLKFTAAGKTSWGIVEGDNVMAVNGDPFGEWQRGTQAHALKDVKIELPLIPRTFYCVGLNYLKHLKEAADKAGTVPNVPDRPEIGYRAQNALIAHDEDVVIPASATETFTTGVDGQLNVLIHVVQGERELAKDCRSLARFVLIARRRWLSRAHAQGSSSW